MLAYLERCGIEFDTAVNVLLGGALSQTLSLRAALAEKAGERWGCVFCQVLNVLIERDHCAKQFIQGPSPAVTYLRSAVAFGTGILALVAIVRLVL